MSLPSSWAGCPAPIRALCVSPMMLEDHIVPGFTGPGAVVPALTKTPRNSGNICHTLLSRHAFRVEGHLEGGSRDAEAMLRCISSGLSARGPWQALGFSWSAFSGFGVSTGPRASVLKLPEHFDQRRREQVSLQVLLGRAISPMVSPRSRHLRRPSSDPQRPPPLGPAPFLAVVMLAPSECTGQGG